MNNGVKIYCYSHLSGQRQVFAGFREHRLETELKARSQL